MHFQSSRSKQHLAIISVFLIALYGVFQLLAATKWGAGLSPDSVNYILSARSIIENGNLKDLGSHYPPLYPLVLAISGVFGVDVLNASRWIQIIIFIINLFIFGYLIFQVTERAIIPTVVGCLLLASSQLFLEMHAMAWSEPLFFTFSLLGLSFIALHFRKNNDLLFLVYSALFFGLALITRYAGITLIITSIISLLSMEKIKWHKRCLHSLLFCVVSFVPFSFWIVRNILTDRLATNREIVFHPVPLDRLLQGGKEISSWFQLPVNHTYLLVLFVAVIIFIISVSYIVCHRNDDGNVSEICFIFIFVYISFILFSISFLDFIIPLDGRILSPVYIFAFLGLLILANRFISRKNFRFVGYVIFILLLANSFIQMKTQKRYLAFIENGIGYASKAWVESDVLGWLREKPKNSVVYSNAPEPIEIYTDKESYMIPRHTHTGTIVKNEDIFRELNDMAEDLVKNEGYIIYFNSVTWRWYLPTVQQLQRILPIKIIYHGNDGDVYSM